MLFEIAVHCLHDYGKRGLALQPAGLSERDDPLHPTISFLAAGPLAAFPPENGKAEHPFSEVVRGVHAFFEEKGKERIHFVLDMADKRPRFAVGVPIQRDQLAKPGIKCSPLGFGRGILGHFA